MAYPLLFSKGKEGMALRYGMSQYMDELGYRQVPVWYDKSSSIADDFQSIAKKLKFLKIIPNPYPFYDWIMGFHERRSNRAALEGPLLERVHKILDAGVGTGYLLSQIVRRTGEGQDVTAIDLSLRMLENAEAYLAKHHILSERVTFRQCNCVKLPFLDGSFDLYVSSYLFDLLSEDELACAIKEMDRVLVPDGHAILITMTTELHDLWLPLRIFYRIMNELYCICYDKGRWNFIWRFLCAGYAPHCRPIALGKYLKRPSSLVIEYTKTSHVLCFPVRIHYLRKTHE